MKVECLPLIRCIGRDGDDLLFHVPSYTREGVIHEMTFYGKALEIKCTCEDSVYRQKVADLLKPNINTCKHVRSLITYVLPRLKEQGLL